MEREIRLVGTAFLIGFDILALGAGYWQAVRGPALAESAGNPRVYQEAKRTQRGRILDRANQALVQTDDGQRRTLKPVFAQTTGYYSPRYGATGIERAFDGELSGRRGVPAAVELTRELLGVARRGDDVQLTVDVGLQELADRTIGDVRGAVVLLDVRTGALLVSLSKPYYDPTAVDENWSRLSQDEARPLYNRVSQGLYVP